MNNIGSLEDEIKEFRIDKEDLEFGEKIGKGGFGFVNKGTYDGEVCAIKQLFIPENCRTPRNKIGLANYSDEDELWKETLNEIAIMLRVQHSNILNVFGWSDDSQCVYIVMEFLPFSLHKVLETTFPEYDYEPLMKAKKQNSSQLSPTNESSQNGKLKPPSNNINQKQVITPTTKKLLGTGLTIVESPMDDDSDEDEQGEKYKKFLQSQPILSNEMKLQIAIDIAEGMHHLHSRPKPIIHRDLKSHNVLLDKNLISKISDFGLSSVRNRNSGVSGMKGTSGWMAPEMFSSAASSGEKADVYSFGMVIYELLTHLIPFHDVQNPFLVASQVIMGQRPKIENAEKLAKESPIIDCFVRLVSTCCLQDPDDRPTFSQILAELKSIPLQNFLEYTVDINGKGDFTAIQTAINALPMDITKIIPKRPLPSHSLTKTFSASSMKNSFSDSNSLKKASSFRTGNLGDVGEYEDCGSSGGVMLGTNNPVKSNPLSSLDISLVDKQRLLMQKFNLPFIVRPSDGRKIIKPTRPLTTPIINIRPGVYKEQILIDRSVVLKGISEGKSHAILYKPKDVEDVILFDNVRYSKIRNLIVYNSEYKPNTKSIGKLPHCSVKLKGSKCDATIEKCTFKGVSLEICEKADPTITGNTIRDSPHVGICIHSGAHGTITDNDIFGSLEANISIKDGGNPTIENNQIHNGMSEGIKIGKEGLGNIVNNKIFSNSGSNVYIGSDADPLVMLNKLFTSEKRGIEISANAKGKCRKNRLCGNREEPQILTSTSAKTVLKDNEILPLPVEAKPTPTTQSANKSSTTTTAKVTTTTSSSSAGQPSPSAITKVNTNANSGKVTTITPPKPSSSNTPNTSNTTVSTGSTTTGRQVTTPLKQSQQQLSVTSSSNNVNNTRNSPLSVKSSTRPSALSVKSSDKH